MGRSKDVSLVDRDRQIVQMAGHVPYQLIADRFGITKQRVSQIVMASHQEISDDAYREGDLTKLEYMESEFFAAFREEEPQLVNARGPVYEMVATDSGKLIQDIERPIPDKRFRLELANTVVKIQERKHKLQGLERIRQQEMDHSAEISQFVAEYERTMIANRELQSRLDTLQAQLEARDMIEAEVIHEEPDRASRESRSGT